MTVATQQYPFCAPPSFRMLNVSAYSLFGHIVIFCISETYELPKVIILRNGWIRTWCSSAQNKWVAHAAFGGDVAPASYPKLTLDTPVCWLGSQA